MKILILLALLVLPGFATETVQPRLLVPAKPAPWTNPVLSRDGLRIAFTDTSHNVIKLLILGDDSMRDVMRNAGVGRRFLFEPDDPDRIVYRRKIMALPDRPERMMSVSIWVSDPISRTTNLQGTMFGPYLIDNRIWYRDSLTGPFKDYHGTLHKAGPYLDQTNGQLRVLDASGNVQYASVLPQKFAAIEISPDGQWVAAVQTDPALELVLISSVNGAVIKVNNAADPGWSGNSLSAICVRRDPARPPELYRIQVPSGSGGAVLSSPDFDPETPILNADGSRAVFVSRGAIYDLQLTP